MTIGYSIAACTWCSLPDIWDRQLGLLYGAWTAVALVAFVAIIVWAWQGKRREAFNEAAQIPFLENDKECRNG